VTGSDQAPDGTDDASCAFATAIAHRCFGCRNASILNVAEGQVVTCGSEDCARRCRSLFDAVLRRAHFINRGPVDRKSATHGQLFRFQLGTLRALQQFMEREAGDEADIDALVEAASNRTGSTADLPFTLIMREIAACRMRKRQR
jgi:hypothetical protein